MSKGACDSFNSRGLVHVRVSLKHAFERLYLGKLRTVKVAKLNQTGILYQDRMTFAHDQAITLGVFRVRGVHLHRMKI